MKKLLSMLLISLFFAVNCYAANVYRSQIMDTEFDASTTTDETDTMLVQGYNRVMFFVVYDETEVGNSISAAITCDISYDGITWLDMYFYDVAGTSTAQTSETLTADGSYCFWIKDICAPYIRVAVAATNTDADDLLDVQVYIVTKE